MSNTKEVVVGDTLKTNPVIEMSELLQVRMARKPTSHIVSSVTARR